MKGSQAVISALNDVLTKELTAINQYFLHSRMLKDWGISKFASAEYHASIDEMKHADSIIQRILFMEGLPNVQKLGRVRIGQNVEEIIKYDLEVEMEAVPFLKDCIVLAEKEKDYVTRDLFASILKSEEHHVDYLETQQSLISKMGIQNYVQFQSDPNAQ